jgi:hypothetical protein
MHRKSENDEHGKTYHFASFCLDGPMLEILESNSWRGVGHAPTRHRSKAIHRVSKQKQ